MSKLIDPQFNDPRLLDIRKVVGLKKDKVPYALLPVRMETRFIVTEKQFGAVPVTFEEAFEAMRHLQIQSVNVSISLVGAKILDLTTEILDLAVALAAITLSTGQRDILKALIPTINQGVADIVKKADIKLKGFTQEMNDSFIKLVAVINGTENMAGHTVTGVKNNFRNQLWVRIFPDDIFVKTHEQQLTAAEITSGKTFWKFWWAASGNQELERAAWATLCTAFGTKRASWIARQVNPNRVDSAKNSNSFDQKPSSAITGATAEINTIYDAIKNVATDNTPLVFFQNIRANSPFGGITRSCDRVVDALKGTRTEQDYLLESFKVAFIKVVSCINTFSDKIPGLGREENLQFKVEIDQIKEIAGKLSEIKKLVDVIIPVEYTAFTNALPEPFDFPVISPKGKDWSAAPYTDCLPTRFVVMAYKVDSFTGLDPQVKYVSISNPVSSNLHLGLDPNKFSDPSAFQIDSNGNLIVEDDIKWMTDYDDAVKKGMAVTFEITEKDFKEGFDHLVVLGIRDADATASKLLLQDLFTSHIYSADGMSFLKVGTPTNNTQHKKSFLEENSDIDERYAIEINSKKYNALETNKLLAADGKVLTDALGLDHNILQYANNNNNLEIANALVMNRALWNAGPGHFMEEMGDKLFSYDNIRRAEEFYVNNCFGRGMLPSLQIGTQPYGVLVTTAFSNLKLYKDTPPLTYNEMLGVSAANPAPPALEAKLQQRFELRLHEFLKKMNIIWHSLTAQVVHSTVFFAGDQQQKFMRMLGLHATSLDYYYRYSLNAAEVSGSTMGSSKGPFSEGDIFGPGGLIGFFDALISSGISYPSFNFVDERPDFKTGKTPVEIQNAIRARIFDQFFGARVFKGRLMNATHPITKNIIDNFPLSETDSVSKIPNTDLTYFDWLLKSNIKELLGDNDPANPAKMPSHALLFLMLRQSLLQAYQEAAVNIMNKEDLIDELWRRKIGDPNFYYYITQLLPNFSLIPNQVTKWALLFSNFTDLNGTIAFPSKKDTNPFYNFISQGNGVKSMANYIDAIKDPATLTPKLFKPTHKADFDKAGKVREAIEILKRVPAADLEILFAEQMDLSTYRLDAWLLGLVNQRLVKQRSKQASGIFLGAFGYVQNLRPAKKEAIADPAKLTGFNLPPMKPVYHDSESQGFIHAPSISQAITAAVLRSAYQASKSQEGVHNRLAVNISSARVRMALDLMEGIRNGQEMGAILGFRFERGLHEKYQSVELDKFIQPFRKAYPLSQQVEAASNGNGVYVSQVVNGSEMLKEIYDAIKWLDFPSADTIADLLKRDNYKALPPKIANTINTAIQTGDNKTKIFDCIIEEIDRMADCFDALGDLAISESVYQVVQGNHVRAAAVLSALAQGKNIPDPQIIETNRTGTVVTHRVILNLNTVANSLTVASGWNKRGSYRSFTEPNFNNWLGNVIGNPLLIKCVISTKNRNNTIHKETVTIDDLGWQPVDLFTVPGGENELNDIIRNSYIIKNNLFDSVVSIDFKERGTDWNATDKTIPEILLLLTQVRNMISNARATGASELMVPDTEIDDKNPGNHDITEFDKRIKAAFKGLQALNTAISGEGFVTKVLNGKLALADIVPVAGDFEKLVEHLNNAVLMGIPNALSLVFDSEANNQQRFTAALQHLMNVYKESLAREKGAAAVIALIDGSDDIAFKIEKLGELAKTVFGKLFIAIPLYNLLNAGDITSQLKLPEAQQITRNEDAVAVESWLQGIGKVRKRMHDTAMTRQMQDINDVEITSLQPVQLPFTAGDYWLGIEYPNTFKPDTDKLSLVLLNEKVFITQQVQSGLILDEWLEIIPGKVETSGITFHYNQPNAQAPQSILLAVSPDSEGEWVWDDLVQTIMDTVELAQQRAVEPELVDLSNFNHVLPSVMAEVASPHDDVAPDPLNVKAVMDFSNVDKL